MKTLIRIAAFLVASMGFATEAVAQAKAEQRTEIAAAVDTAPGSKAAAEAGAFDSLAAPDRKLAEAIFMRQSVTAGGAAPMNLDQIASMQRRGGWKAVYREMRTAGLTSARSVRELLVGAKRQRSPREASPMVAGSRMMVVTNGAGQRIVVYGKVPAKAHPASHRPRHKPARGGSS